MKHSWEWEAVDIDWLIANRIREDLHLDYKACGALLPSAKKNRQQIIQDISKDVSAFANSDGGTIVYGIIEDSDAKVPRDWDEGFDPSVVTREWLQQVIDSNVNRRIDGLRIRAIDHPGNRPKIIYVIWVPQSRQAPHMAADKRFYKRSDTSCVPMEEYEVRDVSGRRTLPELFMSFHQNNNSDQWTIEELRGEPGAKLVVFTASLYNRSPEPAENVAIRIVFDARLALLNPTTLLPSRQITVETPTGSHTVQCYHVFRLANRDMPIWEGIGIDVGSPIRVGLPLTSEFILGWRVDTPRCSFREQYYTLRFDGFRVTLEQQLS